MFPANETASKLCIYSNPAGNSPTSLFLCTSNTVILLSKVISSGKHPEKSLFISRICSTLCSIFPMLLGTHPENLLLANTITEAVEFPKFSGRLDSKRLLFNRITSISLSNSAGGNAPSKLLYRRSRYFNDGSSRITSGNGPTSQLLLKSISKRSFRLDMDFGMIPQKRLEFMWIKARADPIFGDPFWVGKDGVFECLESYISFLLPVICKLKLHVEFMLETFAGKINLAVDLEMEELTASNVFCVGIDVVINKGDLSYFPGNGYGSWEVELYNVPSYPPDVVETSNGTLKFGRVEMLAQSSDESSQSFLSVKASTLRLNLSVKAPHQLKITQLRCRKPPPSPGDT
nr:hypothetical protein PanWU01x14_177190 [Ipomoea batatas]